MKNSILATLAAACLFSASCSSPSRAHHAEAHHSAGHRDRHGPANIEHYIERLESEERLAGLQVERVIELLALPEDALVGDLGCGPGTFALPLARACPEGVIFASDIEPKQLDRLSQQLASEGLTNVVPVLSSYSDPHFPPGRLDLVLIVDTYHHIEDRVAYLRRLRKSLAPGGRLALLEFKPGDLPVGPAADHKPAPGEVEAELEAAGWRRVESFDLHTYRDFDLWRP